MADTAKTIATLAAAVGDKYPCPSGVIAQLIQEVGWSLNTPKDRKTGQESYNLGNIKGTGPAGSVSVLTTEYYTTAQMAAAEKAKVLVSKIDVGGGKWKCQVYANFRAYHSYAEAVDDHLALLKTSRYTKAGVLKATTPEAYVKALQTAGYATDPKYVASIMAIVDKYGLRKYDKAPAAAKPAAKPAAPKPAAATYHTVVAGDNLTKLSKRFGSTVQQMVTWNKLQNPDLILVGQKLRVK